MLDTFPINCQCPELMLQIKGPVRVHTGWLEVAQDWEGHGQNELAAVV